VCGPEDSAEPVAARLASIPSTVRRVRRFEKRSETVTLVISHALEPKMSQARVVVGIDGSVASTEALEWTAKYGALTDSAIEILITWDWPTTYGLAAPLPDDYDPSEGMAEILSKATSDLRSRYSELEITSRVVQGHPARILVGASEEADLLVVGSRGHGEFVGMLIGSVSEYCVAHAHCSVLVHRIGA
jgi:nucleotide-binding universal stress UspA family protein